MTRSVPLLIALLLPPVSTLARGQGAPPPKLVWQRDWTVACDSARAENKPLLLCVMKDSEPACVEMMEKLYTDSTIARRLASFVLVPCSPSTHDLIQIEKDGQQVPSCPRFQGVLCSEHQALERDLRERILAPPKDPAKDPVKDPKDASALIVPRHVVMTADGKILLDRPYQMRRDGFLEFLAEGLQLAKAPAGAPIPRSPAIQKIVDAILKAKGDDEREDAAKELFVDVSPEREEAFQEVMGKLKRDEDQALVIRVAGRAEHRSWAPTIATQLDSKKAWVRDCAVVTLEEEKNPAALEPLLALWEKEKDPETRKDVLRALGPCSGKDARVRTILLGELGSPKDGHRIACALSLGFFLKDDTELAAALVARWQKEREEKVKLAILWGITNSEDAAQVELVDLLVKDERNNTFLDLADGVKQRLRNGPNPPPGGGGGGWRTIRLLTPIYADDKVVRNVARDFGRGGRGGGGGGK
jgi:hypothetical protein